MERTNRGKRAKMEAGKVLGAGPAPYGYRYEGQRGDRHLVIDETTAPIVREIFAAYAGGEGITAIADRLTERKVPSPADHAGRARYGKTRPFGTWTIQHIYPLLAQTAYSGTYSLCRTKRISKTRSTKQAPENQYQVPVPAIVEPAIWAAVQDRRARGQSESRGNQVHEYLVGRHIACVCGYKAHGRSSNISGRQKHIRLWYVCNGRMRRLTAGECSVDLPWFRAETVDSAIWNHIADLMSDPDRLDDRIALGQESAERAARPKPARDELLMRRGRAERANARILDLYEAEEIDRQEWRKRKAANDAEIAALDAQLAGLDAPPPNEPPPLPAAMVDAVRALAAEVAARRDTLPYDGRRRVIEALNVQVTLRHQDGKKTVKVVSILGIDELAVP